jgi:hypothetical protein
MQESRGDVVHCMLGDENQTAMAKRGIDDRGMGDGSICQRPAVNVASWGGRIVAARLHQAGRWGGELKACCRRHPKCFTTRRGVGIMVEIAGDNGYFVKARMVYSYSVRGAESLAMR